MATRGVNFIAFGCGHNRLLLRRLSLYSRLSTDVHSTRPLRLSRPFRLLSRVYTLLSAARPWDRLAKSTACFCSGYKLVAIVSVARAGNFSAPVTSAKTQSAFASN